LLLLAVLLATPALSQPNSPAAPLPQAVISRPAAGSLPWLSAGATGLIDDAGRRVLLRGFNTTTLLEWPSQPIADFDADDLIMLRRSGFNVVRIPIAWSLVEPRRGEIDQRYLDRVDDLVKRINAAGLYVVLDLHLTLAWGPQFGGAGAPRWARVPLVPHIATGEAGDWREGLSPAVLAATTYFWVASDWQPDLEFVWQAVAKRFVDRSGVVGYDLLNEPSAAPLPPGVFEAQWLWPRYTRLIEVIEEVDRHHLWFVEPPLVYELPPRIQPLGNARIVYAPHVYTGSLWPPAFIDDPDRLPARIRDQATDGNHLPAPSWWGELGIDNGRPHAAIWADTALDAFDDLDVGWAWWQWRQDWGWGVRNDKGDFFNEDFFRHLARPYLSVAPHGIAAGRGDGVRGYLRLTVASEHADLPASVAWPEPTLGRPTVAGDCLADWVWLPKRGEIVLTFARRQPCSVEITPA
jgi:endoglycosylceramidase